MNDTYYFPFEGDKHLLTAVILPFREDTWRNKADPALAEYYEVIKAISQFEPVVVIGNDFISPKWVMKIIGLGNNVHLANIPYDDSWARDTLPVFLKNKEGHILGADFGFNSWGGDFDGLYKPWDNDNALGEKFCHLLGLSLEQHKDFILEGGSVHSDGEGTLLVTSCCLLSKGRNPSLNQKQIEAELKKDLRVKKVIWLENGIYNDETDGHVDNICCFLAPGEVLLATCKDEKDPQYKLSNEDYALLEKTEDASKRKLKIHTLNVPSPALALTDEEAKGIELSGQAVLRKGGRRLAASYVNFYMGEKFVLVPQFHVKEDKEAMDFFTSYYKDKKVIPIYSREILLGGGNIHCITKQIPYSDKYKLF